MKKKWLALDRRKKWIMLAMLLSALLLVVYVIFSNKPGIRLLEGFLAEKEEGVWQGKVLSETMTITRQGQELRLSRAGLEKTYRMEGEPETDSLLVIFEDGEEVFRGYYKNGCFLDENGEFAPSLDLTFSYSTNMGDTHYIRDGVEISGDEAMLDLAHGEVVQLLTGGSSDTRGEWWMAIFAAVLLMMAFVFLWWPKLSFRMRLHRHQFWVYRDISDDEPSDWYYVEQKISIAVLVIGALVMLGMGLKLR